MVYNIAEIKYTSCYSVICNLVPKRQTLCTQARAIKSKFLKISKMAFLIYILTTRLLMLTTIQQFNNSTTCYGGGGGGHESPLSEVEAVPGIR